MDFPSKLCEGRSTLCLFTRGSCYRQMGLVRIHYSILYARWGLISDLMHDGDQSHLSRLEDTPCGVLELLHLHKILKLSALLDCTLIFEMPTILAISCSLFCSVVNIILLKFHLSRYCTKQAGIKTINCSFKPILHLILIWRIAPGWLR